MRLLDLYCGAGGASMGYARAGFDVVGIDHKPQPRYPFDFRQGDVLALIRAGALDLGEFDAIHASPPCQPWSAATRRSGRARDLDALAPTRDYLADQHRPWIIENVPGAPLRQPLVLCGSEFGLSYLDDEGTRWHLRRHRLFESSVGLMGAGGCYCRLHTRRIVSVGGHGTSAPGSEADHGRLATRAQASALMRIEWMSIRELGQAIPPDYTEHLGQQLAAVIKAGAR